VCIALCTIVAHNIAQNRPDSFSPYPPDNHHCSDDVYLREGRPCPKELEVHCLRGLQPICDGGLKDTRYQMHNAGHMMHNADKLCALTKFMWAEHDQTGQQCSATD